MSELSGAPGLGGVPGFRGALRGGVGDPGVPEPVSPRVGEQGESRTGDAEEADRGGGG